MSLSSKTTLLRKMIVYGDSLDHARAGALIARLRRWIAASRTVDDWRSALILAGQVEQGLADAAGATAMTEAGVVSAMNVTDALARRFIDALANSKARTADEVRGALDELEQKAGDEHLQIKVPEGFACYVLFPEQYLLSAQRWHEHQQESDSSRAVLVLGVRSIGTTLSAMVAEPLRRRGWQVRRITVRPVGHPYQRSVQLARLAIGACRFALVVDEGPGRSGSSMVAVARALVDSGFPATDISFLPGHDQPPGPAASEEIRIWWRSTRRFSASMHELRWGVRSLVQLLADRTACLTSRDVVAVDDVSGGRWREVAYAREQDWPANPRPERARFLVTLQGGQRWVWKFTGVLLSPGKDASGQIPAENNCVAGHPDNSSIHLEKRAQDANSGVIFRPIRPLDTLHGFTAFEWIEGDRLTRADANNAIVRSLANSIIGAARSTLTREEANEAIKRLREMLACNATELLGPQVRSRVESLAQDVTCHDWKGIPRASGDSLVPHDFLRTPQNEFYKAVRSSDAFDHSCVGVQSLLWDVAGAMVEWGLSDSLRRVFLDALAATGFAMGAQILQFHLAAYAAFRAGIMVFALDQTGPERTRLEVAREYYQSSLRYWLECPLVCR